MVIFCGFKSSTVFVFVQTVLSMTSRLLYAARHDANDVAGAENDDGSVKVNENVNDAVVGTSSKTMHR